MALTPGTRLGPYEITAPLGVGGMGEVYRATDTNLKRQVAIKVLPSAVAADAERLARFQREAEVLAALNHPNIAHLYGLEKSNGTVALVMELVEGPTLADRIAKSAIPIDEALPIAKQIAEALEAAHEQGIIHRDLKPANIKVRPDGTAKILDFGLAKALEPTSAMSADVSASPTITSPAMTQAGIILRTAAYMSPEQAKGRRADKRSDIWAFGAVLYEMLTGVRAFDGEDITDTIVAVMSKEPDWTRLPTGTPPSIHRLLRRTLTKDRKQRLADVADARAEIDDASAPTTHNATNATEIPKPRVPFWALVTCSLLVAAATGAGMWLLMRHPASERPQIRHFPAMPVSSLFNNSRNFAVSADGTRIVYLEASGLVLRRLDQPDPISLPTGPDVRMPFFSPDGQWVGFFKGATELRKVPVSGGATVPICQCVTTPRGAAWLADGSVIFGNGNSGLQRVSNEGGKPVSVTVPDDKRNEYSHNWPEPLPGQMAVLFTVMPRGPIESAEIAVLDLRTTEHKVLLRGGTDGHYVQGGYLVYATSGSLRAVRFNVDRLEVLGTPVSVLDGVAMSSGGLAAAVTSHEGTLVYARGKAFDVQRRLIWVDREGHETPLDLEPRPYGVPRISPEGSQIAVSVGAEATTGDVEVYDQARKNWLRLTFDPTPAIRPVWTPDGRWVLFRSDMKGPGVYKKASDGSGSVDLLSPVEGDGSPNSVTPDGRSLIFNSFTKGERHLWITDLDGKAKARPLVDDPGNRGNGIVSADGRWLAYGDEANGSIYVRPFPNIDLGRWEIATGSKWPLWSRDGRELFYLNGRALMTVAVEAAGPTFHWTRAKKLFEASYSGFQGFARARNYDVAKDSRFLFIKDDEQAASSLDYVENWSEELKAKMPVK
jgi:serine/threonine-protein kinase